MFLGHRTDLENGQSKSLETLDHMKVLINDNGDYKLGNNICPHQHSRIISGIKTELKCQFHGWSWNNDGTPKDAGTTKVCNNSKLVLKPTFKTNGLLFKDTIEDTTVLNKIDFTKMIKVTERVDRVNTDYKHIMDVFLDVDHIPVLHPGVYDQIDVPGVPTVQWTYYDWGSIQEILLPDGSVRAVWAAVYPYTMIEWQPGALFVTVAKPVGDVTDVSVLTYQEPDCDPSLQKLNADIFETAWRQDCQQAESIVEYVTDSPYLDESKRHFRNWLNNEIRI